MGDDDSRIPKIKVEGIAAPVWIIGWLFTIGYAKLSFWQGALGLLIWPYYLGSALQV